MRPGEHNLSVEDDEYKRSSGVLPDLSLEDRQAPAEETTDGLGEHEDDDLQFAL